jgi:hypothetical protein
VSVPGDKAALCGGQRQDARQLQAGQLTRTRRGTENLQLFTSLKINQILKNLVNRGPRGAVINILS